jgi:hypothetical protein
LTLRKKECGKCRLAKNVSAVGKSSVGKKMAEYSRFCRAVYRGNTAIKGNASLETTKKQPKKHN